MSILIIPCYIKNAYDEKCIHRLLESVTRQTTPFEKVLVVDDASKYAYPIYQKEVEKITIASNSGPARARNIGIEKAISLNIKNILFTDHDCVLDENWNKEMSNCLDNNNFGAVGGMTYSFGKTIYDKYHDFNGTLNGKWLLPKKQELWYMPSLNFGMKSYVATEFIYDEKFPTAAGEDVDLCLRLRSKYKIGFCPKAKLWHDYGYKGHYKDFNKFVKLFMKYKSSSATLYEGHTVLLWDSSESIYPGNMYESNI